MALSRVDIANSVSSSALLVDERLRQDQKPLGRTETIIRPLLISTNIPVGNLTLP